jgi:1-aminocyclopropane-1-carboxylate deaminase/D-cysteine desulfhydrase-like pyridoxal-dependent ACC family enzyme
MNLPNVSLRRTGLPGLTVSDEYYGDGYAVVTKETREASGLLEETERIRLDDTYTSKAMVAFLVKARRDQAHPKPLLFWHTGGRLSMERSHADGIALRPS